MNIDSGLLAKVSYMTQPSANTVRRTQNEVENLKRINAEQKKQIAQLQRVNAKLLEEQKENLSRIEELEQEISSMKMEAIDPTAYLEWDWENIFHWILSLDNGRYKKYKSVLRKTLSEEDVQGQYLSKVDAADIRGWGIVSFLDKKNLVKHIEDLIHQNSDADAGKAADNMSNEGGITAFIPH